jgi:aspartate racemase
VRRVGIIGGMGPEATVALMSRVIALVPAQDDADHVPLIVDQNPQVPSRISWLIEGRGVDPGPELLRMARGLEAAGAEAIAMPCNTAHHWAGAIAGAVGVPFIDMVAATLDRVPGRVGVLASPAVRIAGVYAARRAEVVHHGDEAALLALIRAVKRDGATPAAQQEFARLCKGLGTDRVIVACTEFSLLAGAAPEGVEVVDSLDVLAQAVVEFAHG